ncbi:hypothetical protein Droror1_Dr00027231 [Drosera rotundifolia]
MRRRSRPQLKRDHTQALSAVSGGCARVKLWGSTAQVRLTVIKACQGWSSSCQQEKGGAVLVVLRQRGREVASSGGGGGSSCKEKRKEGEAGDECRVVQLREETTMQSQLVIVLWAVDENSVKDAVSFIFPNEYLELASGISVSFGSVEEHLGVSRLNSLLFVVFEFLLLNSPLIIFEDADVEVAANLALNAIFSNKSTEVPNSPHNSLLSSIGTYWEWVEFLKKKRMELIAAKSFKSNGDSKAEVMKPDRDGSTSDDDDNTTRALRLIGGHNICVWSFTLSCSRFLTRSKVCGHTML